jgi:hypothetical protein
MLPLFPALQVSFAVIVNPTAKGAAGSVIVVDADAVHPSLSIIFNVYVPAVNPLAVPMLPPEGLQLYVYGVVPPLVNDDALPPLPP